MKEFLVDLLGRENVLDDAAALAPYGEDYTEAEARAPDARSANSVCCGARP